MTDKVTIVPPKDFLEEFVPEAKECMPAALATLLSAIPRYTDEAKTYGPLMEALNDKTANLCPGFKFVATPTRGDQASGSTRSVDCGMYPAEHAPRAGVNDKGEPTSAAVDWSRIQVSIEVKSKSRKDPFVDTNIDGKSDSAERLEVLGQILDYMKHVFDHQHRTCQYMVVIVEENARLLRIDRSGIFVTKSFNFKTHGAPLLEFFWRFARLRPEERGEDLTAERVTPDSQIVRDIRRRARNAPNDYIWKLFKKSLDDEAFPWWILTVNDECTGTTRRFFVGKPHFKAQGVAGRGTRGYVALELDKGDTPFVHLKDCWRVVHDEIKKEGVILQTLNANNVPHVPTIECHGDMGQTTRSQDLWHKYRPKVSPDAPCPLKKHEHYRLVVKEVGQPLIEFETGFQLLFALFCCLKAHWSAYQLGIIHRDISVGNILLFKHPDGIWRGMLNDWELSKEVDSESPVGRQPDRTGTWQFLSAHALNDSEKLIIIQDELESVFHVLVYMSIRFLPHNCATAGVGRLLYDYFDDFQDTDKGYGCGKTKLVAMRTGQIFFVQGGIDVELSFTWSDDESRIAHPVHRIIRTLLGWFKAYYAVTHPGPAAVTPTTGKMPLPLRSGGFNKLSESDLAWGNPQASAKRPSLAPRSTAAQMARDKKIAENLQSHDAMAELFKEYLDDPDSWPSEDKGADKRPKGGYKPRDEIAYATTEYMSSIPQPMKRDAGDVEELEPPSTPKRHKPAEELEEPEAPCTPERAGSPVDDFSE